MSFINWFMVGETVNTTALCKFARTFATNNGMNIVLESDKDMPRTDSQHIYMPMPMYGMNEDELVLWLYKFFHEIGHNDPVMCDIFSLLREKKIGAGSFIAHMLNLLDDHRQEHHGHGVYEGRDKTLRMGRKLFLDQSQESVKKYGQPGLDKHRLAAETMWVWDVISRSSWMPDLIGMGEGMSTYLNTQQEEWLDKLKAGDYGATLRSGITASEEYDLVGRIITEVFEFDMEEEEQAAQQAAEAEESGEGEEDGEGEGQSAEGKQGGKEGKEKGKAKEAKVDYSDLLMHDHGETETEGNKSGYPIHINYDTNTEHFNAAEEKDYKLYNYTDHSITVSPYGNISNYIREVNTGDGLSGQVRRLLIAKKATVYQHGLPRGKISPKSIFRGGMKQAGGYQNKVFKKKQDNNILNTAVTVLVDCSGSMSGDKFVHAAKAVVLLNEAIGSLKIPVEIIGFTDNNTVPVHTLYKTFTKSVTSDDLIDRLSDSVDRTMMNNSDGESVLWAYNRLLPRKEARKLLIVLSDGSPASRRGDADWHTKTVVDNIEKEGSIELYGIGIMDRNVTRIYKHHEVINHANELESALLKVIKQKILN